MNPHSAASLSIDGPWIEIRGGRTRFPYRPIPGDRLLIGSGSNCDLQLGGNMPMAHSVIQRSADGWVIDALVAHPHLLVRGEVIRRAMLLDGDEIQIGPFSLVAHLASVAAEEALLSPIDVGTVVAEAAMTGDFATSLEALSPEELLDGLTGELTAAASDASGCSLGESLLEEAVAAESQVSIDEEQLIAEVLTQLAALEAEIAARGMDRECPGSGVLPMAAAVDLVEELVALRKSA